MKSYEGAEHPHGLNEYAFKMLKPLLESQEYIAKVSEWKGETIAVDLDQLRTNAITTMPYGSIVTWPSLIWPDAHCDASKAWIIHDYLDEIPTRNKLDHHFQIKDKIIINRTYRWQNSMISYFFLKDHADKLIFAGLPDEHTKFCKEWGYEIPLLVVEDFLELAIAIKSCKFFIGNQSMCFALAEAMKVPRILEVCQFAPNVIPCGRDGYQFMHQFAFEWLFNDLNERL
jgi:hypothetical protein